MGLRAGLEKNYLLLPRIEPHPSSPSLYRLSYLGSFVMSLCDRIGFINSALVEHSQWISYTQKTNRLIKRHSVKCFVYRSRDIFEVTSSSDSDVDRYFVVRKLLDSIFYILVC
jgi:hypothetical protein